MLKGLGWHASPLHPSQTPARFKRLFIASAATTSQLRRPCAVACRPGFQSGRPARTYQRSLSGVVKNRCVADSRAQGRGPNLKKPKNKKKQYFSNPGPGASEPRVAEILFFFFVFFGFLGLVFTPAFEHARCFPRPICTTCSECVARCWRMCRTGHVDNDHNARKHCMKNGCLAEAKCYIL